MISITASTDQATRKDPNFEMSTDPNWRQQVCLDKSRFKKVYHMNIVQHQKMILSNIEYDISVCASIGGQMENLKLEFPSSKLSIYLLCLS